MIKFDVLLSTYNGEAYLKEQLDSILGQSEYLSKVIIRDDGSSDNTTTIIKEYQNRYPELVEFIDDGTGNMGVKESFFYLTRFATAEYMAFCDQDDVWLTEKLSTLSAFINANKLRDSVNPVLIHSDLRVVDKSLNTICDSFIDYLGVDGSSTNVADLLIRNTVTGCAAVVNRPLMELAIKHKDLFKYHDECVAVVAALFESVYFIDKPLILYRQHGNNVVGAPRDNSGKSDRKGRKLHLRYRWRELGSKLNKLLVIDGISTKSSQRLHCLDDIAAASCLTRRQRLQGARAQLEMSEKNFHRIQSALFNKN